MGADGTEQSGDETILARLEVIGNSLPEILIRNFVAQGPNGQAAHLRLVDKINFEFERGGVFIMNLIGLVSLDVGKIGGQSEVAPGGGEGTDLFIPEEALDSFVGSQAARFRIGVGEKSFFDIRRQGRELDGGPVFVLVDLEK